MNRLLHGAVTLLLCTACLCWSGRGRAQLDEVDDARPNDARPNDARPDDARPEDASTPPTEAPPTEAQQPEAQQPEAQQPESAEASPARRLSWPTSSRRPGWLELGVGGGLAALGVALPILFKPDHARWTGGILWDGAVRGGLHLSRRQRLNVATASDAMLYSTLSIPFVELAAVGIAGRIDGDLALRILLVQLQSFGVTGTLTAIPKVTVLRERPYGRRCEADPTELGCDSTERYVSFFSGHTSLTFTAAGLSCVMHQELDLFGNPRRDAAACGLALAAATATGALRVIGDKHWTTDVLAGAAVGLLSGWLMPYLLYFRHQEDAEDALPELGLRSGVFSPWADNTSAGLRYDAMF